MRLIDVAFHRLDQFDECDAQIRNYIDNIYYFFNDCKNADDVFYNRPTNLSEFTQEINNLVSSVYPLVYQSTSIHINDAFEYEIEGYKYEGGQFIKVVFPGEVFTNQNLMQYPSSKSLEKVIKTLCTDNISTPDQISELKPSEINTLYPSYPDLTNKLYQYFKPASSEDYDELLFKFPEIAEIYIEFGKEIGGRPDV